MKYLLLPLFIFFQSCQIDTSIERLNKTELATLKEFQQLNTDHQLAITDETEPGAPLLLCLTFIGKESKQALPGQEVEFYHTSNEGEYEPVNPSDESTARLSGTAITDAEGRIYVQTILPGNYGSGESNRHIHTTVKGAKPEAYDIHFKQHTGLMGKRFINKSDQHFLADLQYATDSTLVTFLTLEVKKPKEKEPSNH